MIHSKVQLTDILTLRIAAEVPEGQIRRRISRLLWSHPQWMSISLMTTSVREKTEYQFSESNECHECKWPLKMEKRENGQKVCPVGDDSPDLPRTMRVDPDLRDSGINLATQKQTWWPCNESGVVALVRRPAGGGVATLLRRTTGNCRGSRRKHRKIPRPGHLDHW